MDAAPPGYAPILPGFHPDPSICRAGDWYYIANSSFEYVPGVPIHRSRDLLTWELVGHALPDAASVNAPAGVAGASKGIYAPTLRHHDGLFWMVTTSIASVMKGQLITHAEDPAGPWSEPVYVPGTPGIDPDLTWDEEGVCVLTYRGFMPPGIHQVRVNPLTGERLGDDRVVWEGTGLGETEGPHLIRHGDYWYIVAAEGGTHTGHTVVVGRSRSLEGPFESCPAGPVLTHRSTVHPVQATGHADLVELADGSWAIVFLGIRQQGSFPRFHVLGRETFLARVEWVDDWPVVVEGGLGEVPPPPGFDDAFDGADLHPRWVAPSVEPGSFAGADAGLWLEPGRSAESSRQDRVLCARVTSMSWEAEAVPGDGDVCLSVRIDAAHWYGVERVGDILRARAVSDPFDQVLAEVAAQPGDILVIAAAGAGRQSGSSGPDSIMLAVRRGDQRVELATLDGRHLSTEHAGGFTGRMIGIEALGGVASVARVAYRPVD